MNKEENSENMIEIKNLRKDYKMYKSKKARLLEAVLPFYQNHGTFSAINDLDLTLKIVIWNLYLKMKIICPYLS